jgi:hypothetical protein
MLATAPIMTAGRPKRSDLRGRDTVHENDSDDGKITLKIPEQ